MGMDGLGAPRHLLISREMSEGVVVRMDGLVHPLHLGDAAQKLSPEVVFYVNRLIPAKRDGPTRAVSSIWPSGPSGSLRTSGSRRPIRSLRPLRPLRSRRPHRALIAVCSVVTASRQPWKSRKSRKSWKSIKTGKDSFVGKSLD